MEMYADRPIYRSFYLDTPSHGDVRVTLGVSYKNIRLRRDASGHYSMSAPLGITYRQAFEAFNRMKLSLPEPKNGFKAYQIDSEISFGEGFVAIKRSPLSREERSGIESRGGMILCVSPTVDLNDPEVTENITKHIVGMLKSKAKAILLPRAREIAKQLGVSVVWWKIGTGLRSLGTCSHDRVITLSSAVLFLPPELRDLIICHELAHIAEMNHSPRFHALLDTYLGGREAQLTAALKTYPWPIIR